MVLNRFGSATAILMNCSCRIDGG